MAIDSDLPLVVQYRHTTCGSRDPVTGSGTGHPDIGAADESWEPNREPTTTAIRPHQAMSGQHDHNQTARQTISSTSRPQIARSASILHAVGQAVMMPSGAAVPVACPMASSWIGPVAPLPACSAHPRSPAAARRRRAGTPSQPGSWSAPSGPSAPAGSRPRLKTGHDAADVPDLPRAFRTADLWLIHAADCCSRYSSWTCCGVRY